jgi:hypothetical protein
VGEIDVCGAALLCWSNGRWKILTMKSNSCKKFRGFKSAEKNTFFLRCLARQFPNGQCFKVSIRVLFIVSAPLLSKPTCLQLFPKIIGLKKMRVAILVFSMLSSAHQMATKINSSRPAKEKKILAGNLNFSCETAARRAKRRSFSSTQKSSPSTPTHQLARTVSRKRSFYSPPQNGPAFWCPRDGSSAVRDFRRKKKF